MVSTKREEMREKHELTDRVGIQAKVPSDQRLSQTALHVCVGSVGCQEHVQMCECHVEARDVG